MDNNFDKLTQDFQDLHDRIVRDRLVRKNTLMTVNSVYGKNICHELWLRHLTAEPASNEEDSNKKRT